MKESKINLAILFLIFIGLLNFGINAVFLFSSALTENSKVFYIASLIFQIVIAIFIIFIALKKSKKASSLFIGMSLLLIAIMDYFVSFVWPGTIKQWWPVYGFFHSAFLIFCGIYKYKKLKFGFTIPAVTLFGMSGWYTLFSFKIIKVPFMTVVWHLGILFLVGIAACLIFFFFLQQKHKELVISDEDSGSFEDETSSVLNVDD